MLKIFNHLTNPFASAKVIPTSEDDNNQNEAIEKSASSEGFPFPKLGLKSVEFENFVTKCGGRDVLKNLTTTQVCDDFVKPMSLAQQSSYCEIIALEQNSSINGNHQESMTIATATVFISHAWNSNFLEVIDISLAHLNKIGKPDAVIWFDLFSVNQHQNTVNTSKWWHDVRKCIREFGHTIVILKPWQDPLALTEACCLWDIYSSIISNSKLDIILPPKEKEDFKNALLTNYNCINEMIVNADMKRSQIWRDENGDSELVAQSEGGFTAVNQIVFSHLRESLTTIALEELALADRNDLNTFTLLNNIALFLQGQGKLTEAEVYLREALNGCRSTLGNENPSTLTSINNMGSLLQDQGKLANAEIYYTEALELRRSTLGNEHPDTLTSINNMGNLFKAQGKLDEAEVYYQEALNSSKSILGATHPDTLISMSNMGSLLRTQGKYTEAEKYYTEALELRRSTLGNEHPDTLTSINNLGVLLVDQSKLVEAEAQLRESVRLCCNLFGTKHPLTKNSEGNLGIVLCKLGKSEEGGSLLRQALHCLVDGGAYTEDHDWVKKFRTALMDLE